MKGQKVQSNTFLGRDRVAKSGADSSNVTSYQSTGNQPSMESWVSAFDVLKDPVWLMDAEGRILQCNEATRNFFGSDIIDRHCWEVVHGTRGRVEACPFPKICQDCCHASSEVQVKGRWFVASVDPLQDSQGNFSGALHVMRDISVRKLAEQRLAEANELLEQRVAERTAALEAANLALRESEANLRGYFENVAVGAVQVDRDGHFIRVNDRYCQITGYSREELLDGMGPLDLDHPADRDADHEKLNRLLHKGEGYNMEKRYVAKDGQIVWVRITVSAILDDTGRFLRSAAVVEDITERKRTEAALLEANDCLHQVISNETVGIIIWDLSTGSMTDANDTFLNLTGYSRRAVEARELTWQRLTPPEFIEASREEMRQFATTGRVGPYEKEYFCQDGSRHWFLFAGSSLGNDQCVEFCVDISGRKKIEAALRESEARFRVIASSTPDHLIVQDRNLRYTLVMNPQLGLSEQEMLGKTDFDFLQKADAEKLTAIKRDVLETGKPARLETSLISKESGEPEYFSGTYVPRRDAEGRPDGVIGYFQNVTERKRAELALQESEARFRALAQASSDVIFWMSPDWTEMRQIVGRDFVADTPEPSRRWLQKYVPPDDQKQVMAAVKEAIRTKSVFELEHRVVRVDGSLGWTFSRAIPILDANGEITQWFGMAGDITLRKESEARLRKSEERFRALVEQSPDGLFVLDSQGKHVLDFNSALCRMSGYSPEEMAGLPALDMAPPEEHARVPAELTKLLSGETVVSEWRFRRKDGSFFFGEIRAHKLSDGRIQGFVRDLTRRKQRERVLAILSGVDHAIVHMKDKRAFLAECCRVTVEEGGFKLAWIGLVAPDHSIQIAAREGVVGYLKGCHGVIKDVPEGRGPAGTCIRENRPVIVADAHSDPRMAPWCRQMRKYGLRSLVSFPLRVAGKPVGVLTVYAPQVEFFDPTEINLLARVSDEISYALMTMDVAEKKREAESNLRKSEQELADFFTGSPVGLLWVSPEGNILRVNQAQLELLGCDEKSVRGRPAARFHLDPDSASALVGRLAAGETIHNYHARLRRKNGDLLHVLIDANGLWKGRRLIHSRWFVRDITRRVELEIEVLKASEQERQRLGQDLHDDLCQQLTGINFLSASLARDLEEKRGDPVADAQQIAQLARNAASQAREIAHGLSPIRPDAEGLTEALKALAENTVKVFRRQCGFHCAESVLVTDPDVALHLYRIAQEAVHNAIKHGKARRIEIQLATQGDKVILGIRDDGSGLPKKLPSHKGLGLRTMQYRVGLLGGSLAVQRRTDGGTEVVCTVEEGLLPPERRNTK